mmetsp:Transcript_16457/g.27889  ORF Transcript_16457/g.27889 Transcript_16457/m.27889 type:complete len:509 (-) Transcript_16457:60-1586(-)
MTNAVDENTNASVRGPVLVSSTSSLDSIAGATSLNSNGNQQQVYGGSSVPALHKPNITFLNNSVHIPPQQQEQSQPQQHQLSMPEQTTVPSLLPPANHTTTQLAGNYATTLIPASTTQLPAPVSLQASTSSSATVPVPIMPSLPSTTPHATVTPASSTNNANTVAEFLYQLTKMLTDDNKEVIEWSNGRIEVHNPHKLASEVLHKYFRHSKFASFQRQLNYFGFRKFAGKGKMAPCSYVNDAATSDLRSLLTIKRKTSATTSKEKNSKKRERAGSRIEPTAAAAPAPPVNPVLAGILQRSAVAADTKRTRPSGGLVATRIPIGKGVRHELGGALLKPATKPVMSVNRSHLALAQSAVGKGVRHSFASPPPAHSAQATIAPLEASNAVKETSTGGATSALAASTPDFTFKEPHQLGMDIQSSLSELSNNFRNSLNEARSDPPTSDVARTSFYGMLSRDSSLVDLAMIPPVESVGPELGQGQDQVANQQAMTFVDFPQDVYDRSQTRESS